MSDSWSDLNIPDAWMATSMLRSMVVDHLGTNKSFDGSLDNATRERMIGLAIMGHLEVADKTARLIEQFSTLVGEVTELADRSNAMRETIIKLAELIDRKGD